MTKQEKEADAREKIKALADWFTDRKLPAVPFKLNEWATVLDCKKFVTVHLARIASKDIYSAVLRASYNQLKALKAYIENGK